MSYPDWPSNIGKTRRNFDINGNERHFTILDEICRQQSTYPEKVLYLQKLRFEEDGRIELRLGYYIIAKKGRMEGKWVWGRAATKIPVEDFEAIIGEAIKKGWINA